MTSPTPEPSTQAHTRQSVHSMTRRLVCIAIAMFGFGYLLIPLYDVFCDVTGLNGKAANQPVARSAVQERQESTREVTVEFIGIVSAGQAWQFSPQVTRMKVLVGKMTQTAFSATNLATNARVAQAVPSVAPGVASKHLNKIECFCFNRQPLASGQQAELPLLFMVDVTLPEKITTITLTYTLFDVTDAQASQRRFPNQLPFTVNAHSITLLLQFLLNNSIGGGYVSSH